MPISSQTRQAGPFIGDGIAVNLPFVFKVFTAADLVVVRTDLAGVETTLTLGTHYSVSLNADQDANPGGTVAMAAAPAIGVRTTITSNVVALQPTDLTNQGGFYPRVITNALDRLTILIQQLLNRLARTVSLPISDTTVGNTTLPTASARGNQLLGFDSNGDFRVYPVAQSPVALASQLAVVDSANYFTATNTETVLAEIGAWRTGDFSTPGSYVGTGAGVFSVRPNTADGADSRGAALVGGGASGASRGAMITAHGNEHATRPGRVVLSPGSTGRIDIEDAAGNLAWMIQGNGVLSNPNSTQPVWVIQSGSAKTGALQSLYDNQALTYVASGMASFWNSPLGILTISATGLYLVHLRAVLSIGTAFSLAQAIVRANGNDDIVQLWVQATAGNSVLNQQVSGLAVRYLTAGTTLQPLMLSDANASVTGHEFSVVFLR